MSDTTAPALPDIPADVPADVLPVARRRLLRAAGAIVIVIGAAWLLLVLAVMLDDPAPRSGGPAAFSTALALLLAPGAAAVAAGCWVARTPGRRLRVSVREAGLRGKRRQDVEPDSRPLWRRVLVGTLGIVLILAGSMWALLMLGLLLFGGLDLTERVASDGSTGGAVLALAVVGVMVASGGVTLMQRPRPGREPSRRGAGASRHGDGAAGSESPTFDDGDSGGGDGGGGDGGGGD